MADTGPSIARLRVISALFRIAKPQKLTWSIFESSSKLPLLTTSSEEQSKQGTQKWTSTNYLLCVSSRNFQFSQNEVMKVLAISADPASRFSTSSDIDPKQIDQFQLHIRVSRKNSAFNREKYIVGEAKIEFAQALLSIVSPWTFSAPLAPGLDVDLSFSLSGASILPVWLESPLLDRTLAALKDVKAIISDELIFSRYRDHISRDLATSLIATTKIHIYDSNKAKDSEITALLSDCWHEFFALKNFARMAQTLHDVPLEVVKLIAPGPKKLFRGNMALKEQLLDAVKCLIAIKTGRTFLPVICEIIAESTSQLVKHLDSSPSDAQTSPKKENQMLVALLFRTLLNYDPKLIQWMVDVGNVLKPISLVLQHWTFLELELTKQVLEVLKFFGVSQVLRMEEFQLKTAIMTIASECVDTPLQVSCSKILKALWSLSVESSRSLNDVIASYLTSSNATSRLMLSDYIYRHILSETDHRKRLETVLVLLEPPENFVPCDADIHMITQVVSEIRVKYSDLLETRYFDVLAAMMKAKTPSLRLAAKLLEMWILTRPDRFKLRQRTLGSQFSEMISRGFKITKTTGHKDVLTTEERSQMDLEETKLAQTSFAHAFLPHSQHEAFAETFTPFFISVLWNQTELVAKVLEEDRRWIRKMVGMLPLNAKSDDHAIQLAMIIGMHFETCTDENYDFIGHHPSFEEDWNLKDALNVSESVNSERNAQKTSTYECENTKESPNSAISLVRTFFGHVSNSCKTQSYMKSGVDLASLGLDVPLAMLMYRLVMVVRELSTKYDWSELNAQTVALENWKSHLTFASNFQLFYLRVATSDDAPSIALNLFSLLDHSWKIEFFYPLVQSLMTVRLAFHSDFNVYVDRERYSYDETKEIIIRGAPRIALAVALRNFLRFFQHYLDTASPIDDHEVAYYYWLLEGILGRLKEHLGKICLRQLTNLWLSCRSCSPSSYHDVQGIVNSLLLHILSGNSTASDQTETSTPSSEDNATLPCDSVSLLGPKSTLAMWEESMGTLVALDPLDHWMRCVHTFRQNFEQLRFAVVCQAVVPKIMDDRFHEDFLVISETLKSMDEPRIAEHWKELNFLLDYFYVPHHLVWTSPLYAHLSNLLGWIFNDRTCPRAATPVIVEFIETLLDILIMLPTRDSGDLSDVGLLNHFCRIVDLPQERVNKKAAWLIRRYMFAAQGSGFGTFSPSDFLRRAWQLNFPLLKYPSTLKMLLRTYASAKHLENLENAEYSIHSGRIATFLNVLGYYIQRIHALHKDSRGFLETLHTCNSNYNAISHHITASGRIETDSLPRMYNFKLASPSGHPSSSNSHGSEEHDSADGTKSTEETREKGHRKGERPNFVPLSAFVKCFQQNDKDEGFGEKYTQFANGNETGPHAKLPQDVHPILFDEYRIRSHLPENDISLNEREEQFGALFEDCLSDQNLQQVLPEEEIATVCKAIASSSLFPKTFVPVALYKNHLRGWFSSTYETQDIATTSSSSHLPDSTLSTRIPKQGEGIGIGEGNADGTLQDGVDHVRVALLTDHFTIQLLDVIEAIFDAIYPELMRCCGHLTVTENSTSMAAGSFPVVVSNNLVSIDPLFLFIDHLVDDCSNYNVFTQERIRLRTWIPTTTYWKWLACMARINLILPHPHRILCGKLACELMKQDIGSGLEMHKTIGEPLFHAVAAFGGLSANPNINKYAPRLFSKNSMRDPKKTWTKEVNEKKRAMDETLKAAPSVQTLLSPSASFFFEDLDQVPSFLVHYLPLLLDAINTSRELVSLERHCVFSYAGLFLWLLRCVPGMIQGLERHCFQLAQFLLNQYLLRRARVRTTEKTSIVAEEATGNILVAIVHSSELMSKLIGLRAYTFAIGKNGDFKTHETFYDFAEEAFMRHCSEADASQVMRLLACMSKEQLLMLNMAKGDIFNRVLGWLTVFPENVKILFPALSVIPRIMSIVFPDYLWRLSPDEFQLVREIPALYWITVYSHNKALLTTVAEVMQRSGNLTLEPKPEPISAGLLFLEKLKVSRSSTYVGEMLEGEGAEFVTNVPKAWSVPFAAPDLDTYRLYLLHYLWAVLPYFKDSLPTTPAARAKKAKEWMEKKLHIATNHKFGTKPLAEVFESAISMLDWEADKFESVKANGIMWRLKTLDPISEPFRGLYALPDPLLPHYGISVVDRVVTVWFEDMPIVLPSNSVEARRNVSLSSSSSSSSSSTMHRASGLKLWILPLAAYKGDVLYTTALNTKTYCRVGFASKRALKQLNAEALKGCGDVEESWALDDWHNTVLAEGAAMCLGSAPEAQNPIARAGTSISSPIHLEYDTLTNAMCVEGLARVPFNPLHGSPTRTRVWVPLPSNRCEVTVYPCISFYTPRRFSFEPIRR